MGGIRVTYSGLVSLAVGLASVATGTMFTVIVTRQLTPAEFGTWGLVGGLVVYVLVIEPVISYWATREVARGRESARTAVAASGAFSAAAVAAYVGLALAVSSQTDADQHSVLLALVLVPLAFVNKTLAAIVLAVRPQVQGYGFMAMELAKIPAAFVLVYVLGWGLDGAIIAVALAHVPSIAVLLAGARGVIGGRLDMGLVRGWARRFWIPGINSSVGFVMALDVLVFSLVTGTVEGLAFWTAAVAVANIVGHSDRVSVGLYPRLLGGGGGEHVRQNLGWLFYFGVPLAVFAAVFARPGLFVLNPAYEAAHIIAALLAVRVLGESLLMTLGNAITGAEKVDADGGSTFRQYLKSRLFTVPAVRIVHYGTYVASLGVMLALLGGAPQLELVTYWAVLALAVQVPFTAYFIVQARRTFGAGADLAAIAKYAAVSVAVFGGVWLLMEEYLEYRVEIVSFLPGLLGFAALAGAAYLGAMYIVDGRTRGLARSIVGELKGRL